MLDSPIKCIWPEAKIKKIKQILNIYLEYKLFAAKSALFSNRPVFEQRLKLNIFVWILALKQRRLVVKLLKTQTKSF